MRNITNIADMGHRPLSHRRNSHNFSKSSSAASTMSADAHDHESQPFLNPHQSSSCSFFSLRGLVIASVSFTLLITLSLVATSNFEIFPKFHPNSPKRRRVSEGYAIVAACTNRHLALTKAAQSWLTVEGVNQIVVVDWNSNPPLKPLLKQVVKTVRSRVPIDVVRVENESHWVLTRAYNLAIRYAHYDSIFKLDCDYVVKSNAVKVHPLQRPQTSFFTGYYMNARTSNELHLNGAMVISQRRFWAVGGYDERIQSYGYDDEDLYKRLVQNGMDRLNVSYDSVIHLQHDDERRRQKHVRFPKAQIDVNQLLLEKIGKPWTSAERPSEYKSVPGVEGSVKAVYIPPAVEDMVSEEVRQEVWGLALGRRLHDDFNVPWGVVSSLERVMAERLLANLDRRKVESRVDEVMNEGVSVRFLLLHVQNGLGNRLRVLASGLSFAARTRREPIVIWEKDVHFGGLYSDVFNESETEFAIIHKFGAKWPLKERAQFDGAWGKIDYYNYLLKEEVGREIVDDEEKNIYFKSSAIMNTPVTTWETENEQLRKLKVNKIVEQMATTLIDSGMENVCGVHIRNKSLDEDIIGVKDNRGMYDKEDAALIDKWRATTKYTSFVGEMRGLLQNGTVDKFFVAADTFQLLPKMKEIFEEGKVMYIERDCDDRSGRCEQFAMADLLVLSKTKMLLGSTWSSFTEAAMRLGGPKALMAGTDFGTPPQEQGKKDGEAR